MHAVIKTGGKQYTVKKGDIIEIELIKADKGSEVHFKEVLFVSDGSKAHVGGPTLEDEFIVVGKLLDETKGPKIESLKYKPTQYKRFGHRQKLSLIEILEIQHHSKKKSETKKGVTHHGT